MPRPSNLAIPGQINLAVEAKPGLNVVPNILNMPVGNPQAPSGLNVVFIGGENKIEKYAAMILCARLSNPGITDWDRSQAIQESVELSVELLEACQTKLAQVIREAQAQQEERSRLDPGE